MVQIITHRNSDPKYNGRTFPPSRIPRRGRVQFPRRLSPQFFKRRRERKSVNSAQTIIDPNAQTNQKRRFQRHGRKNRTNRAMQFDAPTDQSLQGDSNEKLQKT